MSHTFRGDRPLDSRPFKRPPRGLVVEGLSAEALAGTVLSPTPEHADHHEDPESTEGAQLSAEDARRLRKMSHDVTRRRLS